MKFELQKIMKLVTTIIGVLFWTSLFSQGIEFDELPQIEGGTIIDFEINHQGDIVVYQHGHGLFLSKDGAETWTSIWSEDLDRFKRNLFQSDFEVHPDGSFYFLYSGTINKLVPGAIETIKIKNIANIRSVDKIAIDNEGALFAFNSKGEIHKTNDDGENWTQIGDFIGDMNLLNSISKVLPDNHLYIASRSSNNDLYRIKKDGSEIVLAYSTPYAWLTNICQTSNGKYILQSSEGIFISDTGIGNWTSIIPANWAWGTYNIHCRETGEIVALQEDGIYSSKDMGGNWKKENFHLPSQVYAMSKIRYSKTSESYFLKAETGLGKNFHKISEDFLTVNQVIPVTNSPTIKGLKIDNKGTVYGMITHVTGFSGNKGGVVRSIDGGETYQPFLYGKKGIQNLSIGHDNVLFITTEDQDLFRSYDDGISWELIHPSGVPKESRFHISAFGILLASFNNEGIWFSRDEGMSWEKISPEILPIEYLAIHPSGNIYYYKNSELFKYDIFNNNLEIIYTTTGLLTNIFISKTGTLLFTDRVAGRPEKQIYSLDEGLSFTEGESYSFRKITSSKRGYLVGITQQKIYASYNDGLTWQEIGLNPNQSVYAVMLDDDNRLYIGGFSEPLRRSEDAIFLDNFITGSVFKDINKNCQKDSGELPLANVTVSAIGAIEYFGMTNKFGDYIIAVPSGDYLVSVIPENSLWDNSCNFSENITLIGTNDEAVADFPLQSETDCPMMQVDLTNSRMRRCFENEYHVSYCNYGTIAADSAYVSIELDTRFSITFSTVNFIQIDSQTYHFYLGSVDYYDCGDFRFLTSHNCDSVSLEETICAKAHIFPDSICAPVSLNWSGASLELDGTCDTDSIRFKIKNVGSSDMIQPRNYIIIEDVVIMRISDPFQLNSNEELLIDPIPALGQTIHVEVPQIEDHPGNSHPILTIEGCGTLPHTLGLFNQFGQNDNNPFIDIECREVVGSYDPNDKAAVPRGIDVEHKIQPNSTIEYLIRFQNTGTDTAFFVNIIDTLSQWLDVTSFVAGASSHSYEYEISGEGTVRFIFNNIMLPDRNINEAASNGFVKYKIAMKADLPVGTEILNDADIYFDFNEPIRTNETFHVIDEPWILVKTSEVFEPGVEVNAFPNPFQHQATIKLSNAKRGQKKFRLFDLSGKLMRQQYFDSDQFIFEKRALPNGVYFYEISGQGTKIAVGKLIVQ